MYMYVRIKYGNNIQTTVLLREQERLRAYVLQGVLFVLADNSCFRLMLVFFAMKNFSQFFKMKLRKKTIA